MNQKHNFELLLVKDCGECWEVQGITYSSALLANPTLITLKATYLTILDVKRYLSEGKTIKISKYIEFTEAQPKDLIISDVDELTLQKNIAINNINSLMHQTIIGVCVIDAMNFLQSYMQLLNNGIFITDSNREDKYLEIIEKSQEYLEPEPLSDNTTFEEEQQYLDNKHKFTIAQENLKNLETYLNAYDKLFKIKYVTDILNTAKDSVENAETVESLKQTIDEYKVKISAFNDNTIIK